MRTCMNDFPLSPEMLSLLLAVVALLFVLIPIGVLQYAYERLGLSRWTAFLLLILTFLGSYIHIPITRLESREVVGAQVVEHFGMRYVTPPSVETQTTLLAVNIGGAVIPTLLALYLIARRGLVRRGVIATLLVAVLVHWIARPVQGVGITVPVLLPPLMATAVAFVLSLREAPRLAYISGSLGTLIGADLWNLDAITPLGAPVAAIGGAGRFDGIFLTGVLAVLLAAIPRGNDGIGRDRLPG